jgi:hypothetical protein
MKIMKDMIDFIMSMVKVWQLRKMVIIDVTSPHSSIHLSNILHVLSASKDILSTHKFALDNNPFVQFHPFFVLFKD